MTITTMLIMVVLVLLFSGVGIFWTLVNKKHPLTESGPHIATFSDHPLREMDAELTSKAEAKSANKLSPVEQLNRFEQDLEEHDSGNQPA